MSNERFCIVCTNRVKAGGALCSHCTAKEWEAAHTEPASGVDLKPGDYWLTSVGDGKGKAMVTYQGRLLIEQNPERDGTILWSDLTELYRTANWKLEPRTEPASGDVTLVQALRMAAGHFGELHDIHDRYFTVYEGQKSDGHPLDLWLRSEADRLEAAQATREADIRIGRALHKVRNAVNWGKSYTDEWFADYGRTAREAVEKQATS